MTVTVEDVHDLIGKTGLNHQQFAAILGMTRQGLQRILNDKGVALIERHVLLFEAVSMRLAVERADPAMLLPSVRRYVRTLRRIEREAAVL